MAENDPKILFIGKACLDELLYCEKYPIEDTVQRALDRKLSSGGNAGNSCKVLTELNTKCDLFATLNYSTSSGSLVWDELKSYGVCLDKCEIIDGLELPIAISLINEANGSRTFVYYNEGWPEVSYEAFLKIDLSQYSWIHVEVRRNDELRKIVGRIIEWNVEGAASGKHKPIPLSMELENYYEQYLEYMPLADVLILSKDFAKALGCNSMSEAVDGLYSRLKPGATLVVPWAEQGAAARGPSGLCSSPAFPPPSRVLDTLGAGDTFCAALVATLARGRPLDRSLRYACRVAGAKVGMRGFRGLRQLLQQQAVSL